MSYVLAFILLCLPEGTDTSNEFFIFREEFVDISLRMELLDSREVGNVFSFKSSFLVDLDRMRETRVKLSGFPFIEDSKRFPSREEALNNLAFNAAFVSTLQDLKARYNWRIEELNIISTETKQLADIWDNLKDAQSSYYHINVRRASLAKLRELIGEENYYNGIMPPHVPLWRFREIRD